MVERAALVTGGAKRIGRALALALAQDGFAIALHYHRSEAEALETVRLIEQAGGRCLPLKANLAETDGPRTLMAAALQAFGTLNVLVNNASLFEKDTLQTMTPETFQASQQVNLYAPLALIQAFAAQGSPEHPVRGHVINLLDHELQTPAPDNLFFSYKLAKAALWKATPMLARALAPAIRVNAIAPGMTLPAPTQSQAHFQRHRQGALLGQGPDVEDLVRAMRYLQNAPKVTGEILTVNGGAHL